MDPEKIDQAEAVLLAQQSRSLALIQALTSRGPELMTHALRSNDGIASMMCMGWLTAEDRVGYGFSGPMGFGTAYEFNRKVKSSPKVIKGLLYWSIIHRTATTYYHSSTNNLYHSSTNNLYHSSTNNLYHSSTTTSISPLHITITLAPRTHHYHSQFLKR